MKRILSLVFAVIAAAAMLAGCEKTPINNRQANLELSNVCTNKTRAVIDGTAFPQDGHLGLFLFEDEEASIPYDENGCENVDYSYDSYRDIWTADPPIEVDDTPGYLYGYYPYDSEFESIKAIPVKSSLDGDDVMYATKQTVTDETASYTSITMNHALARISLKVVNKGYTGQAKLSSIKFAGAKTSESGSLDATDGTISGTTKADVTLEIPSDKQSITAEGTVYECLLVPSEEESLIQTLDLTLNIDGNDKTITLSGDTGLVIAQNTKSDITITLSNSGISVQTVSVEDWDVVEVGGHKVTVKLAEVSGIEKDIMITAYVEEASVIIKSQAESGRPVECILPDGEPCDYTKNNNTYTFTISDITSDMTATVSYTTAHGVSLNKGAMNLIKDYGHYRLVATVLPEEAEDKSLIWISSNESVVTVDQNGYVKAFAKGSATITAETKVGGHTATCEVTVVEPSRPEGALPGCFSVSDSMVVHFSKGNLYSSGATFNDGVVTSMDNAILGFEEHQYDTTPSGNAWRDNNHISHFTWCANVSNSLCKTYKRDWNVGDVYLFTNQDATTPKSDLVVNGQMGIWRTLSGGGSGEWEYLINKDNERGQTIRSDKYKYGVTVCGHNNCLILLPDGWKWDANTVGTGWQSDYSEKTPVKWSTMESAGAVCFPATGYRDGFGGNMLVSGVGQDGNYWFSTPSGREGAYRLYFNSGKIDPASNQDRFGACSIRLVTEAK